MLPIHNPMISYEKQDRRGFRRYLRRILYYPQMDLEYTFRQMFYLVFQPKSVYSFTKYHKQTKNQWARDDPGFICVQIYFLIIGAISYSIIFGKGSFLRYLMLLLYTVAVDFILIGAILATIGYWIANRYLRVQGIHNVEQEVEWLYAFDIHCNSFFPVFVLLYVVQLFGIMLLLHGSLLATIFSNTLYIIAFGYYFYITFLGYTALPFLTKTEVFLYPIGPIFVCYVLSLLFNLNCSIFTMNLYFG
eukprot:TRINITY_DN10604_c0_g1_i1.p1 TRINITY_DN10604_c0_g1~~TRINITY_DN10604_c0_g1_i1.p1  ORF type:complete len:247 (-),score=11.90 TRINITY_DN10604_c0_g1_i1:93-833(-)